MTTPPDDLTYHTPLSYLRHLSRRWTSTTLIKTHLIQAELKYQGWSPHAYKRVLAQACREGWLVRVKHGVYRKVDTQTPQAPIPLHNCRICRMPYFTRIWKAIIREDCS